METLIKAIQSTPIPNLFILVGLFILVLAFVSKIGGVIEVSSEQKKWTIPTGLLLLVIGLILNFYTAPASAPSSASTTTDAPQSSPEASVEPNAEPGSAPLSSTKDIEQALDGANIDFSKPESRAELANSFSKYPQFAQGCLKLLNGKKLNKKVYFDVIFWNYSEELKASINADSPDGDLNPSALKAAILSAYNSRNGSKALALEDIVESKYNAMTAQSARLVALCHINLRVNTNMV
jgi:hypothetical protein